MTTLQTAERRRAAPRPPEIQCHLFNENNHHTHTYRRGDQAAHCPGRHDDGKPYVTARPRRTAASGRVGAKLEHI
jgi:hypothetical protein